MSNIPRTLVLCILSLCLLAGACTSPPKPEGPNVILIMVDDFGYECVGAFGGLSYETPVLDQLAADGYLFSNCISQPLCTPSRLKIMTGLYNYRNYDFSGHLRTDQITFGNILQEAGYETCIVGKWQLNGIQNKERFPDWNDPKRPQHFGFEEYCLYRLTVGGSRFATPSITRNGEQVPTNDDLYGPDVFADFIVDYIQRKKDQPFFLYYPMVLTHPPFGPTPHSEEWADPANRFQEDTAYFKDMVAYVDHNVGRIVTALREHGLEEHTILIFTGDNGTPQEIISLTDHGTIRGGKGKPTDAGTHVPLIISWPGTIKAGSRYDGLIEFSDFFPTLAEIAGQEVPSDGRSFYPLLIDSTYIPRETTFMHFIPKGKEGPDNYRHQFVRTKEYKLYRKGTFYHLAVDTLEQFPLPLDSLTEAQAEILRTLQVELNRHPG